MREATEVNVVATCGKFLNGIAFRLVKSVNIDFLAIIPPRNGRSKMLYFHWLCFGEVLVPLGHIQTIKPDLFCDSSTVKKENVGCDGCIGSEYTVRHTNNSVQIEFFQQFFLNRFLRVIRAEEEAVGEDDGAASVFLETIHNHGHE